MSDRLAEIDDADDNDKTPLRRSERGNDGSRRGAVVATTAFGFGVSINVIVFAVVVVGILFIIAGVVAFFFVAGASSTVTPRPTPSPPATPVPPSPSPNAPVVLRCPGFSDVPSADQVISVDCISEASGVCTQDRFVCQPRPVFEIGAGLGDQGQPLQPCADDTGVQCPSGAAGTACTCDTSAGGTTTFCQRDVDRPSASGGGPNTFVCRSGVFCDDFDDISTTLITNCDLGNEISGECQTDGQCGVLIVDVNTASTPAPSQRLFSLKPTTGTCVLGEIGAPCTGRDIFCIRRTAQGVDFNFQCLEAQK